MCPAENVTNDLQPFARHFSGPSSSPAGTFPHRLANHLAKSVLGSPKEINTGCVLAAKVRMLAVVLSIGAGSMFLVSLDSVVDNLLPVARNHLIDLYGSETLANLAWSWVVSARSYGLAFGCFCAFLLCNYPSRKWPLILSFLINFLGGLLSMLIRLSDHGVALCYIGRFLSGIGCGMAQIIGAAMLAEIPPIHLRGTCLASLTVWACFGELIGLFLSLDSVLGTEQTWHIALGFPVLLIPIALFFLLTAPDSPRILLLAGKEVEAFESLQFYQKSEDCILSLKDIRLEMAENHWPNNRQNPTIKDHQNGQVPLISGGPMEGMGRFGSGKFVRPLFLGAFVLTLAHLDDWLWISYSTQAFQNAGASASEAQRSSLWMAFPQALVSLILLFCFDGFSRRHLLIWPTLGSICCALMAILAVNSGRNSLLDEKSLPFVASLDLCMAAIASESAYSVVPELFQQADRIRGTALIGMAQNIFGGFVTTLALPLMNEGGIEWVLAPFILLNSVYVIVIGRKLPETSGKSFFEISEHFPEHLPNISLNGLRALPRYGLMLLRKLLMMFLSLPNSFFRH